MLPAWWWPQALMQPRDLDLQLADVLLPRRVGEALGDLLRDRDRAGIGEAAVIEPRAGDDVGDQVEVGLAEARLVAAPATPRRGPACGRAAGRGSAHASRAARRSCSVRRGRPRGPSARREMSPGIPPIGFRLMLTIA